MAAVALRRYCLVPLPRTATLFCSRSAALLPICLGVTGSTFALTAFRERLCPTCVRCVVRVVCQYGIHLLVCLPAGLLFYAISLPLFCSVGWVVGGAFHLRRRVGTHGQLYACLATLCRTACGTLAHLHTRPFFCAYTTTPPRTASLFFHLPSATAHVLAALSAAGVSGVTRWLTSRRRRRTAQAYRRACGAYRERTIRLGERGGGGGIADLARRRTSNVSARARTAYSNRVGIALQRRAARSLRRASRSRRAAPGPLCYRAHLPLSCRRVDASTAAAGAHNLSGNA